jgi:hypothetical protein
VWGWWGKEGGIELELPNQIHHNRVRGLSYKVRTRVVVLVLLELALVGRDVSLVILVSTVYSYIWSFFDHWTRDGVGGGDGIVSLYITLRCKANKSAGPSYTLLHLRRFKHENSIGIRVFER